ncbi:Zn-ribbon domain-containing OB-fold protein [Paraburkholderia sp. HD33-4]|uniref:Zn-ribbon domain-containing OB-fold protein n=1 Tax=Paraburkholderia sp. HD33-4 TaxID=2883242 RepID=UPI001F1DB3E2|nr:zinc ribbon domain-containing protein [Paraburkholderia sp. HD33-4]
MNLEIMRCTRCGSKFFPARYFCPSCGGDEWTPRVAESGTVLESTVVRHRAGEQQAHVVHLATVQTNEGPIVIARLDAAVPDRTSVLLEIDDTHRIVARAL